MFIRPLRFFGCLVLLLSIPNGPARAADAPASQPTTRPALTPRLLHLFDGIHDPALKASLPTAFTEEFWRDEPTTLSSFYTWYCSALIKAGLSQDQAANVALVSVLDWDYSAAEAREALVTLQKLFVGTKGKDWLKPQIERLGKPVIPQVTTHFSVEMYPFDGEVEEPASLPKVSVAIAGFVEGKIGLQATVRALRFPVDGPLTAIENTPKATVIGQLTTHPNGTGWVNAAAMPLDPHGSCRMRFTVTLRPNSDDSPVSEERTYWKRFTADNNGRITVNFLGVDGQDLHPDADPLITKAPWMFTTLEDKEERRGREYGLEYEAKSPLIGTPLKDISLAATAQDKTQKGTLELPQKGIAVVYFGATWCAPCNALHDDLTRFVTRMAKGTVKVVSVDELSAYDKALQAYPDGIASPEIAEVLAHTVPRILVLQDGKIVMHQTPTAELLTELARKYGTPPP